MGVVFSLLKDNKKETDVEYPSQLVSMPKPVQKRPKAYSDEDIIELFSAMVDEEGRPDNEEKARYLFFLHTGCREQEVVFMTRWKTSFSQ
jgi:integrase